MPLLALEALATEIGDRKALVILGDGTSDDTAYVNDQVVKAAKDAGIAIHVLRFLRRQPRAAEILEAVAACREHWRLPGRVRRDLGEDYTKDIVTNRARWCELLGNGSTVTAGLKGPAGDRSAAPRCLAR